MIGTKFRIVRGYTDDAAEFIALEKGEIFGLGSSNYASLVRHREWKDKLHYLYWISLDRLPYLPDLPTIGELVKTPRDKDVMRLLGSIPSIGITLIAPPKIPPDREAALRGAMQKMFKDPAFAADLKKLAMDMGPLSGEEVSAIVSRAMRTPPATIEALKALTAPMN
jgi:tripartite-type tricarboxylate transporter receptor subunit TctC